MSALLDQTYVTVPHPLGRPSLDSYDSGEEFSFYHWIKVCQLVDQGDDDLLMNEGLPCSPEFEEALKKTLSEVESATAYQNFAGNVV